MTLIAGLADRALAPTKPVVRWVLAHGLPSLAMRRAARGGDLQGRLVTQGAEMTPDDVEHLATEVRASGPVHRARFAAVTASLPVVKEVLTSPDFRTGLFEPGDNVLGRLSVWANGDHVFSPLAPPSLLATEPPDHTRYRKLVTRVFTARAVEEMRARTQQIADQLLDDLVAAHGGDATVDLVESYCALLPVTVIAEILGVPAEERPRVLEFGSAAAPSLDLGLSYPAFRRVEEGLRSFDEWLDAHLELLHRQPGDDLMSKLVAARDDESGGDGKGLTELELKATAGLVLAAGFETTVNLLGNGIALILEHPAELEKLRADPALWSNAVDEVLRVDPPVLLTGRLCSRDTTIAGEPISKGTVFTTLLAGANRDPAVFADPSRFDVARENARDHVAFSSGRHYCLGASLARMEGEVGLRTLFDRFPDLQLRPGAARRTTRILRGYETLPAVLGSSRHASPTSVPAAGA